MAADDRTLLTVSAGGEEKAHLSICFVGHVDSGKSTLVGHLLELCGGVTEREMDRLTATADALGKTSFRYAFVCDQLKEERERGITITQTVRQLETPQFTTTLIDAPGHRDFLKNTISAISQADIAVLVVDAQRGAFEAGIQKGRHVQGTVTGGARETLIAAGTMGVPGLIVVVNKMDSVGNDQDRFDEIKAELQPVIRRAGYKVEDVAFIPVSAWPGHNIVENHEDLAWYHGPSLLQAIDRQEEPPRMFDAALRLPVADVYKIAGVGTVVTGRIVSGTMSVGDTVRFCGIVGKPVDTTVESIEMHHEMFEQALTGDNVGFKVNAAYKDLKRGMVLSRLDSQSAECVDHFTARLVILDHPGQLRTGYTPVIDIGSAHVTCRWTEILEKFRNNPNDKEENPAFVRNGDKCLVRMVPQKPLVVEEYREFPSLGRFAIREGNHIVAIGRVEAVNRTIQEVERGSGMITKSAAKK